MTEEEILKKIELLLNAIHEEIKGLRQDLKEGKIKVVTR